MTSVTQFSTEAIRNWAKPQRDTAAMIDFPRTFVAPPRLALGLSKLDIDYRFNIRIKATVEKIERDSAIYHVTSWGDTLAYSGVVNSLDLAPANLEFRTGEHMRDLLADPTSPESVHINFDRPFATPPKVAVFINAIDLGAGRNWRLETTAINVDRKGFTLKIRKWGDTILFRAQAVWVAYPEDREHIFSTSVSTSEVRPWTAPQAKTSRNIPWGVKFARPPTVFVGLSRFDINCNSNFRLHAHVDNVSNSRFVWHLDTWGDTCLYSAVATVIAFD